MVSRKNKKEIAFELTDWRNREVVVPLSVVKIHLPRSHPSDAGLYTETLRERFKEPDIVLKRTKRNELEFVINLENRDHRFLVVYVKYESKLERFFGKVNYVATVFGTNQERTGEIVWRKAKAISDSSTTK